MSLTDRVKAATAQAPGTAENAPAGDPASPGTDLAVTDAKRNWLEQYGTYIGDALPQNLNASHFKATAYAALDKVVNCDKDTVRDALLACARFGLAPDGKHAAIVPFGKTATFVPMYEGFIELMFRSGRVDSVHFGWIREADQWDYIPSAPSPHDFVHKPRIDLPKSARGPVILAYAFAWIKGGGRSQVILLNRYDAEEIRDEYSKSYKRAENSGRRDSAWHTNFDGMWAKSCVRRLAKVVPTSQELIDLLRADEAADMGMAPAVVRVVPPSNGDNEMDAETGPAVDQGEFNARPETGAES